MFRIRSIAILLWSNRAHISVQSRTFLRTTLSDVLFRSLRGEDEKEGEGKKNCKTMPSARKEKECWSVSDIIVVDVSGVGKTRVGRKAARPDAREGESSVAHAPWRRQRYNLELCTGGMWQYHGYVLRASWATPCLGTAYAYEEKRNTSSDTSRTPGVCTRAKVRGGLCGWVRI
jgi:hypothetical protein